MDYELKDIRTDIIEACQTVPVVVDFWAEWCGPCKALSPVLEKLVSQSKGRWKLVKVDVDNPENQALASQFQIRSIPAVRMIYQGKMVAHFDGALPEAAVKKWLNENLPEREADDDQEDETTQIEKAIESGDRAKALEIAKKAYEADRESDEIKVQLALLLLPDDTETAEKLLSSLKEEGKYEIEKEVIGTIKHIKEIADGTVKPEPADAKQLPNYVAACKDLLAGNIEKAVSDLINIVMIDRSLDDDGARKACVAIFKMLGEKHPVSQAYRRRFSMALY